METKQLTEIERQARNGAFVMREIFCCQSMLVEGLLKKEVFNFEDIENFTKTQEELLEDGYTQKQIDEGDTTDTREIFEWWVCSDWLIEKLRDLGQPILSNDYGEWWGRCCTGQAIKLDTVIDRIIEG